MKDSTRADQHHRPQTIRDRGWELEPFIDAALGVLAFPGERAAEMAMITPRGEKTHHITYGGPPRSVPRWAVNLALDWLRRRAADPEGD